MESQRSFSWPAQSLRDELATYPYRVGDQAWKLLRRWRARHATSSQPTATPMLTLQRRFGLLDLELAEICEADVLDAVISHDAVFQNIDRAGGIVDTDALGFIAGDGD